MYEGLINNLNKAADKWEKEHPIIGVGQLRVHDALRDAARALKEADYKIEQVTLERDAAVRDIRKWCCTCKHCGKEVREAPCNSCRRNGQGGTEERWEWRGVTKEE